MSSEIQKELGSSICTVIFVKVDILRGSQDGKNSLATICLVASESWVVTQTPAWSPGPNVLLILVELSSCD